MNRLALKIMTAAVVAASAAGGIAVAQSAADAASEAAIACLDVSDAAGRLECLENAAREIKATRIRPETAAESAAADAASAPVIAAETATEEELFGAEALASVKTEKREKDKVAKLSSKVVEFRVNRFGDVTAVLENGQVWRQLSGDSTVVRLPKSDKVFTVTIKKGPLGNYLMKINELKRSIRVRRIK